MSADHEPVVTTRCVACQATREVRAGEVGPDELPMCHVCSSPMVAVSATSEEES